MKKYKLKINGNSYHVDLKEVEGNLLTLEVNGTSYEVELEKEVKTTKTPTLIRSEPKPGQKVDSLKTKQSTKKITAPLPGTILKIMVREGDHVKTGDPLLILEAMKMENTILAEASGTVSTMNVQLNASVLQGDVMLEII